MYTCIYMRTYNYSHMYIPIYINILNYIVMYAITCACPLTPRTDTIVVSLTPAARIARHAQLAAYSVV